MKISFCTTCRGRLHDLRQTLKPNLDKLLGSEEIIVLSYNCIETSRWVQDECKHALRHGQLRLYTELTAPRFFMAHAKNVSHLLSHAAWMVNLDADNFLDNDYLLRLRHYANGSKTVMLYPHQGSGGFKGRVAVRATAFVAMGGYDEQMNLGYGYEECDLYRRWKKAGLEIANVVVDPTLVIPTPDALKAAGQVDGVNVSESAARHRRICEDNLRSSRLIANQGVPWGVATVSDRLGDVVPTGINVAARPAATYQAAAG